MPNAALNLFRYVLSFGRLFFSLKLLISISCVVEPVEYDDFDGEDDAVDLRAYQILGGVIHFNLLQMPSQPKIVKDWTLTQRMLLLILSIERYRLKLNRVLHVALYAWHCQRFLLWSCLRNISTEGILMRTCTELLDEHFRLDRFVKHVQR